MDIFDVFEYFLRSIQEHFFVDCGDFIGAYCIFNNLFVKYLVLFGYMRYM